MKIMYLLFSFTVGGTEKLIVDTCNEMADQGNDIYLYIVNDYYSEDLLSCVNQKVNIVLQNRKKESLIKTMFRIHQFIVKEKIDVVHCNSFNSPELLLLTKILCKKIKIVYTVHGLGQYDSLNKCRIIYRNIICDKIIAISESVKKDIIHKGAHEDKIKVVYNAIDTSKFVRCVSDQMHKINKEKIALGNVARIVPEQKGQDILIRAVAILKRKYPEIKVFFAGGIDREHEKDFENLKKLTEELELKNNVVFMGNVSDIPEFLEKIDIFILPSRFEGFGISLIEAMAMGIPCIASNLNGPAEIIGNNEYGFLFENENVKQLADQVVHVIENYEEIKETVEKNTKRIKNKFDIKSMCKELLEIYNL